MRVRAAFLLSGFWKAGTPSAIASTPVRATAPDAKARSSTISADPGEGGAAGELVDGASRWAAMAEMSPL